MQPFLPLKRRKSKSLFELLESWIKKTTSWAQDNEVRVRYMCRLQELPYGFQNLIQEAVNFTETNQGLTLNVAFNYNGSAEIIDAVNKLISEHPINQVDENTFGSYLYIDGTPDVGLVIKTAGEYRISNFMIWQIAYVNSISPISIGRISILRNPTKP